MKDVKKNVIYNTLYQILILIIPLVTLPYVSRILGAEGIGIYSYTYSIVNYFMIVALLGMNKYGNRAIAKSRDDKDKLSKEFCSLYAFQLLCTILVIFIYLIYISIFDIKYKTIAIIQLIYLFSTALDINWFFFGLEKFKITVTRNTIIKICSLILIFLFVKTKNDIWKYALILSGSALVSNLILFPFVIRYINFTKVTFKDIFKHLKPSLILFLPVIAVSVYRIMDKIMLGVLSSITEVGYYENAEKIIQAPLAVITAFGTVMLPRITNMMTNDKNYNSVLELIKKTMKFIMFVSLPIVFGIIVISNDFSVIFFGKEFNKVGMLMNLLAFNIFFFAWGNVIRTQYLIPKERDKDYVISGILGAIVNFVLNSILIPRLASVGACIGTLAAEFVVIFYQTFVVRKELPIRKYMLNVIPFLFKAIIMFLIVNIFNYVKLDIGSLYKILLQVLIGGIVYFLLNISYIKELLSKKNIN